jgi:hypothetical protein
MDAPLTTTHGIWRLLVAASFALALTVAPTITASADSPTDRGVQGGLNQSSQYCLVPSSVGVRRAPRRVSSSRGSCGAAC